MRSMEAFVRGFIRITGEVKIFVRDAGARECAVTMFIRHTAASLTIQENADPSVLDELMTALVAALGLLPAALSTGIGSDTQKPFALVIVGGLFSRLLISVFLMPALYSLVSRTGDVLEVCC